MTKKESDKRLKKQLLIMGGIVIGMFGFCFALIPIYSVFCKVTGLNGKTTNMVQVTTNEVDYSRSVTVELLTTLNDSLPNERCNFKPQHKKLVLHPGEMVSTSYYVANLTNQALTVQAIPSVTPGLAAQHVKKMECFCFQKQPLAAFEGKDMPLIFTVDPALPNHIKTITLAYTLFDVTQH